MKKLIFKAAAVFTAAVCMLSMFSANVFAESTEDYKLYKFDIQYDGTLEITGCSQENISRLDIPAEINGRRVTKISNNAFRDMVLLQEVTFPDGLMEIGSQAFSGCISLKSAEIPDSVETLGYGAFEDCGAMESVKLSGSLEIIPSCCFENCVYLKSVVIPDKTASIRSGAFNNCMRLESVYIPHSVKSISSNAFANSDNVVIHCRRGSYAEKYAVRNGITYAAEPPSQKESVSVAVILGVMWGAVVLAVIICVIAAKKQRK